MECSDICDGLTGFKFGFSQLFINWKIWRYSQEVSTPADEYRGCVSLSVCIPACECVCLSICILCVCWCALSVVVSQRFSGSGFVLPHSDVIGPSAESLLSAALRMSPVFCRAA